jgi:hypothetical protein
MMFPPKITQLQCYKRPSPQQMYVGSLSRVLSLRRYSYLTCSSMDPQGQARLRPSLPWRDNSLGMVYIGRIWTNIQRISRPDNFRERVLELNASDERGIGIVRDKVKNFARQTPRAQKVASDGKSYPCPPYKIIILDEADSMTQDAQGALRRIMETYARITRFCLVCNYVTRSAPFAGRLLIRHECSQQNHRTTCITLFQISFHTSRLNFIFRPTVLHRERRKYNCLSLSNRHPYQYFIW